MTDLKPTIIFIFTITLAGFPLKYILQIFTTFFRNLAKENVHLCVFSSTTVVQILGVSSSGATFSSQVSFTTAEEDRATHLNQLKSRISCSE